MGVRRVQFPVSCWYFAVVVYRSRGKTLDKAVVDLRRDAFISRVSLCRYIKSKAIQ